MIHLYFTFYVLSSKDIYTYMERNPPNLSHPIPSYPILLIYLFVNLIYLGTLF